MAQNPLSKSIARFSTLEEELEERAIGLIVLIGLGLGLGLELGSGLRLGLGLGIRVRVRVMVHIGYSSSGLGSGLDCGVWGVRVRNSAEALSSGRCTGWDY